MLRKESEAVPEGNGPTPQQKEFGSGEPTLAGVYRMFKERFDRRGRKLDAVAEDWRSMDQRLTRLEHDARQPRLAMRGRRARKDEDSRAHGGRRQSSSS